MLVRSLLGVSAAAFLALLGLSVFLGLAIVQDVVPQIESVGFANLELGHLLGASWAANAVLVAGAAAAVGALVLTRRERRR